MRVAVVTNARFQPTRGNHTTIGRWLSYVKDVQLGAVAADADQELRPVPDVVHGYHLIHGGVPARALAERYRLPLVVSLGGTDLFACLQGDQAVADVLEAAVAVTGAFPQFGDMLAEYFGRDLPFTVVPRGVPMPPQPRERTPDGRLRVLVPSGLRPVKDPMLAIDMAERLVRAGLPVRLKILGPELDSKYAGQARERAAELEFATVHEVMPEEMPAAYADADVVWNTSLHEGGANALLEAVGHGCALYARDITGNRELLHEKGSPGVLFDPDDHAGCEAFHRRLLAEKAAERNERVARGREWLQRFHDPLTEARTLEALWRRVAADA